MVHCRLTPQSGYREVFDRHMGSRRAAALGISGGLVQQNAAVPLLALTMPCPVQAHTKVLSALHLALLAVYFAGDRTQNMMWRLSDGELPAKAPKLVVLEIGSNDISYTYFTNTSAGEGPILAEVPALAQRCGALAGLFDC